MKKNLTFLYACTFFAYWMGFAAAAAFASMYLLGFSVSDTMIGTVIAAGNIATAVLQPILGTLSDKNPAFSVKRIIAAFMILAVLMSVILLAVNGRFLPAVCFVYGCCLMSIMIAQPFLNSLGMICMNREYRLDFGISRAAGSLGYAAAAFLLGLLTEKFGTTVIPAAIGLSAFLLIVTLPFFPKQDEALPTETVSQKTGRRAGGGFLRKYKGFLFLLAGLVGIYYGHMILNNYTLQIVMSKGGSNAQMGTATSLAAVLELIVMLSFSKIQKKISLETLLKISVIFFTLKILGSLLAVNMFQFYLVQIMQMLGWGIMAVALVYYVNEIMEPEDCTKGQAYAAMTYTVGSIAAAWSGGILLDAAGVKVMLLCGLAVSAAGAAAFVIGLRLRSKKI